MELLTLMALAAIVLVIVAGIRRRQRLAAEAVEPLRGPSLSHPAVDYRGRLIRQVR